MKTFDARFDNVYVNVIKTSDKSGLILSVSRHPISFQAVIGADAARDLASSLYELADTIDEPGNPNQTALPFAQQEMSA